MGLLDSKGEFDLSLLNKRARHLLEKAAQEEHASIAAFARLTLQLMALGAPPELISASIRAQADELSHAQSMSQNGIAALWRRTRTRISQYGGHICARHDGQKFLMETILDGCINETIAAAEAGWMASQCTITPIQKSCTRLQKMSNNIPH